MSVRRKPGPSRPRKQRATPSSASAILRLDRIVEARRRIHEGWYDRTDVRERLVEAVLDSIQPS